MKLNELQVDETYEAKLLWAFPKVSTPYRPYGGRVIVQLRRVSARSSGGIHLTPDAIDTERWNTQVGVVVAVGPLAFKNKDTLAPWPEGVWAKVGDFVRTPKYGGDRVAVDVPNDAADDVVIFAEFNDSELLGEIAVDPLSVKAFI